jgi:hypothetical protein
MTDGRTTDDSAKVASSSSSSLSLSQSLSASAFDAVEDLSPTRCGGFSPTFSEHVAAVAADLLSGADEDANIFRF